MAQIRLLRAHISEIEELINDLLPAAKAGCQASRSQVVSLQKQVFDKRERLRSFPSDEG